MLKLGLVLLFLTGGTFAMADQNNGKIKSEKLKKIIIQPVVISKDYSNGRVWRSVQEIHGVSLDGKILWKFIPPVPPFDSPTHKDQKEILDAEPALEEFYLTELRATEEIVTADYVLGWNEGTAHVVLDTKTGKVVQMKRQKSR